MKIELMPIEIVSIQQIREWVACLFMLLPVCLIAQHKPAYRIVDKAGNLVDYYEMLADIKAADVILFGELHDNPICHWLELELIHGFSNTNNLVIGMEMIERDNNELLQSYIKDSLTHEAFDSLARLWTNYDTDYKPIVDLAKEQKINIIGTNVPRRFARTVYSDGFEGLDDFSSQEKEWIAPLPITYDKNLPGYKAMLSMFEDPAHANENLPKAQALKDATMAHFLLTAIDTSQQMFHINGSYHSENFEGMVWYLQQYKPSIKIKTIASREQRQLFTIEEEDKGVADYTIIVNDRMTKSY